MPIREWKNEAFVKKRESAYGDAIDELIELYFASVEQRPRFKKYFLAYLDDDLVACEKNFNIVKDDGDIGTDDIVDFLINYDFVNPRRVKDPKKQRVRVQKLKKTRVVNNIRIM